MTEYRVSFQKLYEQAESQNPTLARKFLLIWMSGSMSTQQFKDMLMQIVNARKKEVEE